MVLRLNSIADTITTVGQEAQRIAPDMSHTWSHVNVVSVDMVAQRGTESNSFFAILQPYKVDELKAHEAI